MTVVRKLRLHIIASAVAMMMFVLAGILITLDVTLSRREQREIGRFLDVIIENGGRLPAMPRRAKLRSDALSAAEPHSYAFGDVQWSLRSFLSPARSSAVDFHSFFSLVIKADGSREPVSSQFPATRPEDVLESMVEHVLQEGKPRGLYGSFCYKLHPLEGGDRLLVMLNCQSELATFRRLYGYSLLVWLLSLLATLLFSYLLSGAIVRPVAQSLERQKNFISDAGHELKTPIAVIAANVDVLMSDMPDNRWLQYIKAETERMNRLVKDLLFLARDDAGRRVMHTAPFDLSNAVENAVLPFESICFEQGKRLVCDVQAGLSCTGDEQQIKQVVVILVDNAIKNSEQGAVIRVTARQEAQKSVVRVYNTGAGIAEADLSKIFLRFSRSDASRARKTGGYGLGLAIAKAISDAHGATLTAASKYGEWAEFTFALAPQKPSRAEAE